jgi:hypothetical protein
MGYSKVEFKKVVSMIIVISIMVSVVCKDIAYANGEKDNIVGKAEVINKDVVDIVNDVPIIAREYGKVTKVSDNGLRGEVVVQIQDLHSHEGVQRNIEKIIEVISEKYRVRGILVEGGYDRINLGWLEGIKNKLYREKSRGVDEGREIKWRGVLRSKE